MWKRCNSILKKKKKTLLRPFSQVDSLGGPSLDSIYSVLALFFLLIFHSIRVFTPLLALHCTPTSMHSVLPTGHFDFGTGKVGLRDGLAG